MSNSHRPPDRTRRDSLAKSEQLADRITLVAWRLVKNVSPSHMQQSTACYTLVTYLLTYLLRTVYRQAQGCVCTALQLGGDVEQPWLISKYDVIHKTVST